MIYSHIHEGNTVSFYDLKNIRSPYFLKDENSNYLFNVVKSNIMQRKYVISLNKKSDLNNIAK